MSIQEMGELARKHGGECLSTRYISIHDKLQWKCSKGHEWEATPANIGSGGTWCPSCAVEGTRLGLQEMQQLAAKRGGKCLSQAYVNANTKVHWCCAEGHEWEATPNSVKTLGQWCPICAVDKRRLGLQEMQQLAVERGGECLSDEYVNTNTPLRWRCRQGHEWEAPASSVKHKGAWCRICRCKAAGEARRGKKTGRGSNTKLTLEDMQDLAKLRGGECVSDEYINAQTKLHWRCRQRHEWEATPHSIKYQESWCPICAVEDTRLGLQEMRQLAADRGGKCLSTKYINNESHLHWRCSEGHEWESSSNNVKEGKWCPSCAIERRRLGLEEMKQLAAERSGECLSGEYVNTNTHLRWRCSQGHEWEATPANIKDGGTWCPDCSLEERRLGLQEMQQLAAERGGECLSNEYVNAQASLVWRCSQGHEWQSAPVSVKYGGAWCPTCARKVAADHS